jgi:glycosyltransferase involved in cell wall biosynthesis
MASRARLLLIGDGAELADVRRILDAGGATGATAFAGLVPQAEGPAHLAACDILASPHVPNPDGTPFFGSPTKLFEYMAMGRAIVASRLDQIADVLDETTAVLVTPGDDDALARALGTLVAAPEMRGAIGAAARARAIERHTWRLHVRRTLDRLLRDAGGRQALRA